MFLANISSNSLLASPYPAKIPIRIYRDGFILVFKSNKCILSKFGTSIGKGYDR
jgi:hypothetical protein